MSRRLLSRLLVSGSLLLSDTNVVLVVLLAQIEHVALLLVCQFLALPLATQVDARMQPGEIVHHFHWLLHNDQHNAITTTQAHRHQPPH